MKISKIFKGYIITNLIISICYILYLVYSLNNIVDTSVIAGLLFGSVISIVITSVIIYAITKKDSKGFKFLFVLGIIYFIFVLLQTLLNFNSLGKINYYNIINILYNVVIFGMLIKEFENDENLDSVHGSTDSIIILIIGVLLIVCNVYNIVYDVIGFNKSIEEVTEIENKQQNNELIEDKEINDNKYNSVEQNDNKYIENEELENKLGESLNSVYVDLFYTVPSFNDIDELDIKRITRMSFLFAINSTEEYIERISYDEVYRFSQEFFGNKRELEKDFYQDIIGYDQENDEYYIGKGTGFASDYNQHFIIDNLKQEDGKYKFEIIEFCIGAIDRLYSVDKNIYGIYSTYDSQMNYNEYKQHLMGYFIFPENTNLETGYTKTNSISEFILKNKDKLEVRQVTMTKNDSDRIPYIVESIKPINDLSYIKEDINKINNDQKYIDTFIVSDKTQDNNIDYTVNILDGNKELVLYNLEKDMYDISFHELISGKEEVFMNEIKIDDINIKKLDKGEKLLIKSPIAEGIPNYVIRWKDEFNNTIIATLGEDNIQGDYKLYYYQNNFNINE